MIGKKALAFHEAGHAVISRVLGIKVPYVSLLAINESAGRAVTESAAWRAKNEGSDAAIGREKDIKLSLRNANDRTRRPYR
jgi:hypothetical protein